MTATLKNLKTQLSSSVPLHGPSSCISRPSVEHACVYVCVCVCAMEWPMDDKVIRLQQTSLLPLHTMHITKGVAIVIK